MHLGAFKTIASLMEKGLRGAIVCYNESDKLEFNEIRGVKNGIYTGYKRKY